MNITDLRLRYEVRASRLQCAAAVDQQDSRSRRSAARPDRAVCTWEVEESPHNSAPLVGMRVTVSRRTDTVPHGSWRGAIASFAYLVLSQLQTFVTHRD